MAKAIVWHIKKGDISYSSHSWYFISNPLCLSEEAEKVSAHMDDELT